MTDEDAGDNPNHEEGQGREQVERQVAELAVDHQDGQRRYPQNTTPYFTGTNSSSDETII